MSDYRRWKIPEAMYFFTVVTQDRRPLFGDEANRTLLGQVMRQVAARKAFDVFAIVLLPDHLHSVWAMPHGDPDFSVVGNDVIVKVYNATGLTAGSHDYKVIGRNSRGPGPESAVATVVVA